MTQPDAPRPSRRPLKVGLIVDSTEAPPVVRDLVTWARGQPTISLTHLVVQATEARPVSRAAAVWRQIRKPRFGARALFAAITRIEALGLRGGPYRDHLRAFDLGTFVPNVIRVRPLVSKSGFVYRFRPEDLAAIRAAGLDVLIRCGNGILRGEILEAVPFGILSFHHADNTVNRGGPPGFWEVRLGQHRTGFTIQRLTEELDGGHVLRRGAFLTQRSFLLNQASLFARSNTHLEALLLDLAEQGRLPDPLARLPYSRPLYRLPSIGQQVAYVAGQAAFAARRIASRHVLKRDPIWGVAFSRCHWRDLVMWRAVRIPNPPGRFLADPFVVRRDGRDICFVEDFSEERGRGCISAYELRERHAERLGEAIVEPFHMSFPFLFEHQGDLYLVPETSEAGQIRLYRCSGFPLRWDLVGCLMDDVHAVDTMLVERGGSWWLLTNLSREGHSDHSSELFLFRGESPVGRDWTPCRANPVVVDPTRGRNGGLLHDGADLFRVAQRQGFRRYGAGLSINRVTAMTTSGYQEEQEATIEPEFFPGLLGTHHLHGHATVTVFDYLARPRRRP